MEKKLILVFLMFMFSVTAVFAEDQNRFDQEDKINRLPGEVNSGFNMVDDYNRENSGGSNDNSYGKLIDTGSILDVYDYIFDFDVFSPIDSWSPALKFAFSYLINSRVSFGFSGYFYNRLNFNDYNEKFWYNDADGNKLQLEREVKRYNMNGMILRIG